MKTSYVIVPVKFWDGDPQPELDLGDDGQPGLWGDTYVYDEELEEGDWVFDGEAQVIASEYVEQLLRRGDQDGN